MNEPTRVGRPPIPEGAELLHVAEQDGRLMHCYVCGCDEMHARETEEASAEALPDMRCPDHHQRVRAVRRATAHRGGHDMRESPQLTLAHQIYADQIFTLISGGSER